MLCHRDGSWQAADSLHPGFTLFSGNWDHDGAQTLCPVWRGGVLGILPPGKVSPEGASDDIAALGPNAPPLSRAHPARRHHVMPHSPLVMGPGSCVTRSR